jgi:hypothetical protein
MRALMANRLIIGQCFEVFAVNLPTLTVLAMLRHIKGGLRRQPLADENPW